MTIIPVGRVCARAVLELRNPDAILTHMQYMSEAEVKELVLSRGCFAPEKNIELYEKWFRHSPRYLFKAAAERYGISKLRMCDVGSSYGSTLLHAARGSYGIEIVQERVDFAKSIGLTAYRRDVLSDDLSDLPKVEALWCCAVLEHVDSPHVFLRKLWSLLEPEGRVFLWVPTIPPRPVRFLQNAPFVNAHLTAHTHTDHVNAFTPATIRFMAERGGFETIEVNALYPHPFRFLGTSVYLLDGVMYVGKKKPSGVYRGRSTRKGKAAYFDAPRD